MGMPGSKRHTRKKGVMVQCHANFSPRLSVFRCHNPQSFLGQIWPKNLLRRLMQAPIMEKEKKRGRRRGEEAHRVVIVVVEVVVVVVVVVEGREGMTGVVGVVGVVGVEGVEAATSAKTSSTLKCLE